MDKVEILIKRYLRIELSKIKARDSFFTQDYLNKEFDKLSKHIAIKNEVIPNLYERYRFGAKIMDLLNNDKFYHTLTYDEFPMLFKFAEEEKSKKQKPSVKKNSVSKKSNDVNEVKIENIKLPTNYEIIQEQIPIVRKALIRQTLRYIAFMELKRWIKQNGLTLPEIKNLTDNSEEEIETSSDYLIVSTIRNHLLIFKDENKVSDEDYKMLLKLLLDYFIEKNQNKILKKPIFIRNGSKKKLASALGEIYRQLSNNALPYEYLLLGKNNISLFQNEKFTINDFQNSRIYKYYCSNSILK